MKNVLSLFCSFLIAGNCLAQKQSIDDFEPHYINWYNKDYSSDNIIGSSIDKTYSDLLSGLTPKKTVVVAVIDGGVDIHHKDLEGKIWINTDEIPDNGIDDDANGYIDDINGWNFIGNADGKNVYYENLEYTRIVKSNDANHKDYARAKELYERELKKRLAQKKDYTQFKAMWDKSNSLIKEHTSIEVQSHEDLLKVKSNNEAVLKAKSFLEKKYAQGVNDAMINRLLENNAVYLDYYLNMNFNPRELVGDDPLNIEDKYYGNNDVAGPEAYHGTSVAGVIAANRHNGIGIDGIASHVKIMVLRSTPKGDERDKDVALAIMYAVDNGADIINMSFSKDLSPQKEFVDIAVKYAEEKGVLLVHGAGNKGENLDVNERFPSDKYLDNSEPYNWLNVGATQMKLDEELAGIFSNYGENHVDIFAPGVDVISLDERDAYLKTSGTSIAAPVISGVAALILSYYPELSTDELIAIIMDSAYKVKKPKKVLIPSLSGEKRKKVKFSTLSKSGGIVNVYDAFKLLGEREQLSLSKSQNID
ncbi:S8 family serine peptidase [Carboxylicivirga marina]|uniref:S8 family serine peptidase n=1 Tax=Carboxylicivirga marina TaxID=2800988 RepID=A0ABS1HMF6_9BACT|nr:S8 family serine peptidase [Carboxylicivirga marina]MBK3518859.1 S8 family serine peptidase [Carboxylicivirga marina]